MILSRRFSRVGTAAVAASLTAAVLSAPALADVKLVQTTTMTSTGGPGAGQGGTTTMSTTAYYKGNKARQENQKQITIFDADSRQIYLINPAQKTYSVTSLSVLANNPYMKMVQFKTDVKLTPLGRTKTIAGQTAKGYTYTSTTTMSVNMQGQPGGAQAKPNNMASMLPTIRISGETWVVENLPASTAARQIGLAALSAIPGMENLGTKLGSIKGLPVESVTNTTISGGMMQGGKVTQISVRSTTKQIAQTSLPASLFAPPAGYRKVETPVPGMGGPMRGGTARPGGMR